jgi:hypothetical protein
MARETCLAAEVRARASQSRSAASRIAGGGRVAVTEQEDPEAPAVEVFLPVTPPHL